MRNAVLVLLLFAFQLSTAQIVIDTLAWNDMENVPQAPVWTYTGTPAPTWNGGFSIGTAAPPNSPIGIGGSRAWETTSVGAGVLMEFANTTIPSGYDSIRVHYRLAAMNLVGSTGGPDNLDYVLNAYSTDGGTTWVNRLRVRGSTADNSFWAYSATGVAKTYYTPASEVVFQPSTTGLQTTFGYSNVEVVFPGNVTQIAFRITARSSSSTDTWLVDNVTLTGERLCSPTTSTITATACQSYTSPSGNHTWTSTGTYQDTLTNLAGCDSLITVNLTIHGTTGGSLIGTYCDSLVSPSGHHVWTMSGLFYDTIPNMMGCDSIIVANIVIFQATRDTLYPEACELYVAPSGFFITGSGIYTDIIPNMAGCDSIITLNVTIHTANTTVTQSGNTLTAATNATYQWLDCNAGHQPIAGQTLQSFTPQVSGNYAVAVTSLDGCVDTSSCTQVTIVGLAIGSLPMLSLFPNPAASHVSILVEDAALPASFAVVDLMGKVLKSGYLVEKRTIVDLESFPSGLYFLRVEGFETVAFSKE